MLRKLQNMKIIKQIGSELSASSILMNKYVIVTAVFFIWLLIFDKHNYMSQRKLAQTLENLEGEKQRYLDLIEEVKLEKIDLAKNKEKYAREHYFMHKENEEVFVFDRN